MIVMERDATPEQIEHVIKEIKKYRLKADVSRGKYRTIIGLVGDERKMPFANFQALPGVKEARAVEMPYRLISREYSRQYEGTSEPRIIKVGNVEIGGDKPIFIAGPCAIEGKEQLFRIAEEVKKAGANILRGGIFKPRSSVHNFQGLGSENAEKAEEVLNWLKEAGKTFELVVTTEARGEGHVDLIAQYVDIIQIGTRNMYNQDLLTKAAGKKKPVLLKRSFGAGIEEFLSFAEYIVAEGNKDVILCERGILPLGKGKDFTRYTLDLAAIPVIQKETYLPVVVDPSHATGRRDLIHSMSCAAIAAGASGLMIEAHYNPEESLVDARQMVTPDELSDIIKTCQKVHQLMTAEIRK